jgi:hypothetical protein
MIPSITQAKLNQLADDYAQKLLANVKQVFEQPEYRSSDELLNSLSIQVTRATSDEPPRIILTYADQGFFIGYKNPQWTKLPIIEKLKQWADSPSFSVGSIPGYKSGTASGLSVEKQKERIVWAIAKNKRKEDTWKQKKWKNAAGLGDLLSALNKDTLQSFAKDIEKILVDGIAKGTVMS